MVCHCPTFPRLWRLFPFCYERLAPPINSATASRDPFAIPSSTCLPWPTALKTQQDKIILNQSQLNQLLSFTCNEQASFVCIQSRNVRNAVEILIGYHSLRVSRYKWIFPLFINSRTEDNRHIVTVRNLSDTKLIFAVLLRNLLLCYLKLQLHLEDITGVFASQTFENVSRGVGGTLEQTG